ncbi:hypothetical protein C1645_839741 [Glomus cerebriforme]|uniref:Reverse transcriptase RNase H-like domain-containing protein n=1 Tax=Glomus cerebriforme TaxID=658196 RepID=A0A397S570_9GLOM|nr:hypothetical protein C1645_839741 [Glomus cerebriforme]
MLITDGSKIGLEAVLAQTNEDSKEVVIAYGSRNTVGIEKNYPLTELEYYIALKELTDVHRSGKKIKNADALSRLKFEEKKLKYIKSENKWFDAKKFKGKWDDVKYFNDKKAILLNLKDKIGKELLKKLEKENKSQDGVNGFKRRRDDDKRFEKPLKEYEWLFRKQVVKKINKRLIKFTDENIIILDKLPYCEYFYQKTKSFYRGYISPYRNHKMEKEIFKYKDIIDNAIVIFLENKECWNNYIGRETKKSNEGHKASYETLNKEEYRNMVEMFKEH